MSLDNCYGTGTVHWSDDSYAQGSYPCDGCSHEKCPARKEAAVPTSIPSDPDVVSVKVQIPVSVNSVGQRDQIQHTTRKMTVTMNGSNVVLSSDPPTQAGLDTISFPWAGIEAAVRMLGTLPA